MGGPKKISPLMRFNTKFSINENGCWIWTAAKMKNGYGRFGIGGNRVRFAHRWIYEQTYGKIPDGMVIDHLCRNPSCVNPEHLEAVTHRENTLRGTACSATNAKKTHCPQGHEYTPENTILSSRNQRHCRICVRERLQKLHLKRRPLSANEVDSARRVQWIKIHKNCPTHIHLIVDSKDKTLCGVDFQRQKEIPAAEHKGPLCSRCQKRLIARGYPVKPGFTTCSKCAGY